jgi:uncharacterized protein
MSLSLREQLLKAGLVTEKQVKQAEQQQSQQQYRQQHKDKGAAKAAKPPQLTPAQKAQAEKAARDRELNKKKEEKAARRARAVAINQLVEQTRIPRVEEENPEFYNFVDGGKIYRIAIVGDTRERILRGDLLVARYRGFFALISKDGAEKIRAIDPNAVLATKQDATSTGAPADDPYKDFVVPDDLKW